MIFFYVIGALLTAGVLLAVLAPLAGGRRPRGASTHAAVAAVYRDQLLELERDLAAGLLALSHYEEARADIERRLLADLEGLEAPPETGVPRTHRATLVAALALPLAAYAVYWTVGSPQAVAPRAAAVKTPHTLDPAQVEAMIAKLAARLEREPGDVESWTMLARSYSAVRRYGEAARAYEQAGSRGAPDAQLLADHADALAMAQGRRLRGDPEPLIARALTLDPDHVKALALAGSVAFEKREYDAAIGHWQRLLTRVPAEADLARSVRGSIAQARLQLGAGAPAAAGMR